MRTPIVLERLDDAEAIGYRVAYWLTVKPGREAFYANPAAASAFLHATQPEIDALRAGSVVEVVREERWLRPKTQPQARAELLRRQAELQAAEDARADWTHYGTHYDTGAQAWVTGGVA